MKHVSLKQIVLEPNKGVSFEDVCREALSACLEYNCEVRFTFNGTEYKVTTTDMFMAIKDQKGTKLPTP